MDVLLFKKIYSFLNPLNSNPNISLIGMNVLKYSISLMECFKNVKTINFVYFNILF